MDSRNARFLLIVLASVALGAARLAGVRHIAFQAVAHLWVGGLVGAQVARGGDRFLLWVTVALSVLELGAFVFLPR